MASVKVKVLLLILILGLPVLLYLFLQSFGENKYQVPVMYMDGIPDSGDNCPGGTKPHTIDHLINPGPCEIWNCSQINHKLVLFSFVMKECDAEGLSQVARVINQYQNQSEFRAVTISVDQELNQEILDQKISQYSIPPGKWLWWSFDEAVLPLIECGFDLRQDCYLAQTVVMVDQLSQIRGYYDLFDPQETDRLVTEIAILLNS